MRLCVTVESEQETRLPVNYQHLLTALVYGLLGVSDADYARRMHDDGYGGDGNRHFKLFTFSWLRGRCRVVGETIRYAPGPISWQIASPVAEFVQHLATGLLGEGTVRMGGAQFPLRTVEALPSPPWETLAAAGPVRLTCLSPIVASVPQEDRPAHYLTPADTPAFSETVRRNLLRKHRLLLGTDPADDRFTLTFDPAYLARSGGGTKLITYKDIQIRAAFAPCTVTGSPELLSLGYDAGFGEKNAAGFGMTALTFVPSTRPETRDKAGNSDPRWRP
jgi:CRISPR-associated endoribonuclease Cas6